MRKTVLFIFAAVLSILMVVPLSAQDRGRRRAPSSPPQGGGGQQGERAQPRRQPPPPQRGGGQDRERAVPRRQAPPSQRGRVEQPRRQQPPPREYAVPRTRPLPRPHQEFGPYNRMLYQGQYFFWRPYPRTWYYPNTCIAGYWDWDWDSWSNDWIPVWIEGYCNIPGYRPYPGFYFWFDFGR